MSNCNDIDKILQRSGTGQFQRYLEDLNPDNFELHNFDIEDWILFAYNFAQHINYFETSNSDVSSNNWQDFFKDFAPNNGTVSFRASTDYKKSKEQIVALLAQYEANGALTPHLTLFVCFLQLLEFSKSKFNQLTKRHLDFYYKEILQVNKLPALEDKVHVIFELAKKSIQTQIVNETELNANKDVDGNSLIYKTTEELIVNQTKVASLKSVYNDVLLKELKASATSNTLDGLEEPLLKEAPYWYPFGYNSEENNFSELANAKVGFALASPLFNLKEGLRIVEISIVFNNNLTPILSADALNNILKIQCSGVKEWISINHLLSTINDKNNENVLYKTSIENNILKLAFQLEPDSDAVVKYNSEVLVEKYNTVFPIIRFLINTEKESGIGYDFYKSISKLLVQNITIKVDVRNAKSLVLENDFGVLKPEKPFYPFTTKPVKKSNFYIDYPEVFSKEWKHIEVEFDWKNTPDNFKNWYKSYLKAQKIASNKKSYVDIIKQSIANNLLIVKSDTYFKAEIDVLSKEKWVSGANDLVLFSEVEDSEGTFIGFKNIISVSKKSDFEINKVGPIRLSLNNTFLHELYPRLYALALTDDTGTALIPNEPYTPLAENISINYTAEETITITADIEEKTVYENNRIQLFHEHPFGQCEEHNYLKKIHREKGIVDSFAANIISTSLVSRNYDGGTFFIGLESAKALQTVSLLVQVLEGSENPLTPSFEANELIDWSILCDNEWKDLKNDIVSNNTNNFLSSGILKFSIPREATEINTVLPEGYIWLRARMLKAYNAICKVLNVHTQAVEALFKNQENELSHLENGLEADTIKKLITRVPQIKSVAQPYNSFDGQLAESDNSFYRRISERLRHKNRAISLWDYEHLILQKFPEIYKVKCLNHSKMKNEEVGLKDNFIAAGFVTAVVIPDTVNKNVFDIFQPRVSTSLLNKIENYINQLNTMHVCADVINPDYEEVQIALDVRFYDGYDNVFYAKQMEEDIIKFLSPWAFDVKKEITFGNVLHRSILIDYLEKLTYVDYLQNVKMYKNGVSSDIKIAPTSPKSILVSAKKHSINIEIVTCLSQEKLKCQV